MTNVSMVRPLTRSEEAYLQIKRRIIDLDLPPGSTFTEAQLMATYRLSKTPVREALLQLRREGLVQVVARSGYQVTPVTIKDTRNLFALRSLLEGEAARLAAMHIEDAAQLRILEDLARTRYDPQDPTSMDHVIRANVEFHVTIARAAGNDRLAAVLEQVLDQLERVRRVGLSLIAQPEEWGEGHRELLEAVMGGNAELAHELAVAHVRAGQKRVVDALLSSDVLLSTNVAVRPESLLGRSRTRVRKRS